LIKNNTNKGFTTIEALATIFVFSILALLVAGIFAQTVRLQRRAGAAERVQEDAIFVLESMAKRIRVSEIHDQDSPDCSRTTLDLDHPVSGNIRYYLSNGEVRKTEGGRTESLSSSKVEFTQLAFCVTGSIFGDNLPTRVTIVASLRYRSTETMYRLPIYLQTTITTRSIVN